MRTNGFPNTLLVHVLREGMEWKYAYLLTQADARTGVEGEEDERIRHEIFLHPLVKETIRVELKSWQVFQNINFNRSI